MHTILLKPLFECLCPGPDSLVMLRNATHPQPSYDIYVVIVPNAEHEQTPANNRKADGGTQDRY